MNDDKIKFFQNLCKTNIIACVVGFPRKFEDKIFNSVCFIEKSGEIAEVYDKTHLFGDKKKIFDEGSELKVVKTAFGKSRNFDLL